MAKGMSARARLAAGAGSALGVALLVAACSTGSSSPGAAGSNSPAGASSSSAAAASGGSDSTVITTVSSSAGTFLANGSGHAVYLRTKDSNGMSACSGACAGAWPPVTTTGTVTASGGAKSSDLGTITRSDGTKQVTYDGHPLYTYIGDHGPGTAAGNNINLNGGLWLEVPVGSG